MNRKIYLVSLIIISVFLTGCEEVIPLDLKTADPKIVVEAAIKWEKGDTGNIQSIRLSKTTSFYSNTRVVVSNAVVSVTNDITKKTFVFSESETKGTYDCNDFIPVINDTYTLKIISNGITLTASEKMRSVTPMLNIEQNDKAGPFGDQIQLKAYFKDPANETNYYMFRYNASLYVLNDDLFNGNTYFSSSRGLVLNPGEKIEISHSGISKEYFNYLQILSEISSNNSGGRPFQSAPATVRGNVINTTNPDDYPLGYFSLSESVVKEYQIK